MRQFIVLLGTACLAGCGQGGETANQTAAPAKQKTPYCFFKDADTKGWTASVDAQGNVVVEGKAYRSDGRYKALLGQPKVSGAKAEVWPTVTVNDTGHSAPDNWWDVSLTIPGSAAVETVDVRCGKKVLASLAVPRKK